jgi:hypothetical protein
VAIIDEKLVEDTKVAAIYEKTTVSGIVEGLSRGSGWKTRSGTANEPADRIQTRRAWAGGTKADLLNWPRESGVF